MRMVLAIAALVSIAFALIAVGRAWYEFPAADGQRTSSVTSGGQLASRLSSGSSPIHRQAGRTAEELRRSGHRCRGTSLGGRSGWRQATPWTQSIGMGPRDSRAVRDSVLIEPSLCRGNWAARGIMRG